MDSKSQIANRKSQTSDDGLAAQVEELTKAMAALQVRMEQQQARLAQRPAFTQEDNVFLVWVLGFTAGAHLDKPGEGERIFAWCRQLQDKLFQPPRPGEGGNPS